MLCSSSAWHEADFCLVLIFGTSFRQTDEITNMDERELTENMQKLFVLMSRVDQKIAPMLDADGEYFNQRYILV